MKTIIGLHNNQKKTIKNSWSFEKKITFTAIFVIISGFITFGEVLAKISQLNDYMKNTNDIREELASVKSTTDGLILQTQDIRQSINRIENHLLNTKK